MDRPNETLLQALLIAALVVGSVSGVGLVLAAVGDARERGWRQRIGIWLPAIFGASLAISILLFGLLVAGGTRKRGRLRKCGLELR